jgi:membrane-associated protease RseP (regulator of RpoE activity)
MRVWPLRLLPLRLWPFRRRPALSPLHSDDLLLSEERLRHLAEEVMVVQERQIRGGVILFRGDLRTEPARALDTLLTRFAPLGYTPFLKAEGDRVMLQAWPLVQVRERARPALNLTLFVLTALSTLAAGAILTGILDGIGDWTSPAAWLSSGGPFALTLLSILGVHEFGHYFTARYYKASVSLPYFIPAPPPIFLFGTLGAIIRMRSPARDRNSLFDIAAAGPLAGLMIAVPAVILGLGWSEVHNILPGAGLQFGDSLLMRWLVYLKFGSLGEGVDVIIHPVALAGWVGFFVTALNLVPVGQLDGGRIAYALLGRHHRVLGIITFVLLLALGGITGSGNWFFWAGLLFFLVGFHHSPPLDDLTPLSPARRLIGIACLILLVLLIPPVPIKIT